MSSREIVKNLGEYMQERAEYGVLSLDYSEKPLPERRLLAAILERRVMDLRFKFGKTHAEKKKALNQAIEFFLEDGSEDILEPFSFMWICSELGLDAHMFLSALAKAGLLKYEQQVTK